MTCSTSWPTATPKIVLMYDSSLTGSFSWRGLYSWVELLCLRLEECAWDDHIRNILLPTVRNCLTFWLSGIICTWDVFIVKFWPCLIHVSTILIVYLRQKERGTKSNQTAFQQQIVRAYAFVFWFMLDYISVCLSHTDWYLFRSTYKLHFS